jgi:small GTP-binding protein
MGQEFVFDVFLSHSSKDKGAVRAVAERLRRDGLKVWFDEWEIKPGDEFRAKIEEGLEHSRVLVLCMSAHAFGSEWVKLEADTFQFRNPSNKDRRFIALRLDDAPIKGSLAQFLYIDWFPADRQQEYAKLVEACRPTAKPTAAKHGVPDKSVAGKASQLDYKAEINGHAFSPDGNLVLSGAADGTMRLWKVASGRCLRIFKGHHGRVAGVTWSPNQRQALSAGWGDSTIRLWDVQSGECTRIFKGHRRDAAAWSATWGFDQKLLLSAGDETIRLWEIETGRCLQVFKGHASNVYRGDFHPNSRQILSCSMDNTVRLWDVETGRCLRVLEGHANTVRCVIWDGYGSRAVSGSNDKTIRLWDIETGRCVRIFQGHCEGVTSLAWSVGGHYLLSGSYDKTVRLWDTETGKCLRILEGHKAGVVTVAWSADGRRGFSGDEKGGIWAWKLSNFATHARAPKSSAPALPLAPGQVQYTNAKVLLVGDTGVGKSALAERLIHQKFIQTKSSHARKAYVLESNALSDSGGVSVHQETVLWDLAGQPAFRLVHQLSMDDAALACVLLDNRNETNPFESAAYWSQVLDQARSNTKIRKILVASRIDVGGLPAGRERIEAFCSEHGFDKFIATSATSGEGCEELLNAIRSGIHWEGLPKVTTEGPLAPLRDYIASLKAEKDGRVPPSTRLFTIAKLHEGFSSDYWRKISLDEFIAHLKRLEDTDAVDLLVFSTTGASPTAETLVLLDPTRVDAYASALMVAAKDEPDGPGHLLESRVREVNFKIEEDERLVDPESEKHVLWFVMETLLNRDLALRERIKGDDYFVFPSQCTAALRFPGMATFGVAFGFAGAVRSIYATLIAQLAHYEGFKKREFFHDAAAYRPEAGGRCIVRVSDKGRGDGELELSFAAETPPEVRQGFIDFVGKHLESKSTPGSLTKRHAYHCANEACRKPFDDAVVKARLEAKQKKLVCPYCEKKSPLVNLFATPSAAAESVAKQIGADATKGRQRMTAALVIKAKEAEKKFDAFFSYNSKDKAVVEKIAKRLKAVGIRPWLDKWNLSPGDNALDALEVAIKTIPCAALCFGPADVGKWHVIEIRAYVEKWAAGSARMIPVILPEVKEAPELPLFVRQPVWVDMRKWEQDENESFYLLVCGILRREPGESPMKRFGVRNVAEWQGIDL